MTLIVKKIDEKKKGVFSDRSYEANDVILRFQGASLNGEQLSKLGKEEQDNVLQIGTDHYLNLVGETAHFIRHNCNANSYVKAVVNTAFLIATRPINKGDEITFDYSLTSADNEKSWVLECACHRFYCRKIISGFNTLSSEKKEEMIKAGWVPRYIKT